MYPSIFTQGRLYPFSLLFFFSVMSVGAESVKMDTVYTCPLLYTAKHDLSLFFHYFNRTLTTRS